MTEANEIYNRDAYGTALGKPYRERTVKIEHSGFDSWLAGYLLAHPESTTLEAVMYWLDQEQLALEAQS